MITGANIQHQLVGRGWLATVPLHPGPLDRSAASYSATHLLGRTVSSVISLVTNLTYWLPDGDRLRRQWDKLQMEAARDSPGACRRQGANHEAVPGRRLSPTAVRS